MASSFANSRFAICAQVLRAVQLQIRSPVPHRAQNIAQSLIQQREIVMRIRVIGMKFQRFVIMMQRVRGSSCSS